MTARVANGLHEISLPPLPYVAHEVLLGTLDERVDAAELAERLRDEPGLAARVVAAANAAWFAGRAPVEDLRDAVVRLGLTRLRSLVTGLLVAPLFDGDRCPAFEPARFWRDAVATGFAAGQLARHAGFTEHAGHAAMAGLLRNIGVLLLAHALPAETDTALRSHAGRPDLGLACHFREAAAVTPAEAGAMLLEAWALPEPVVAAVGGQRGDVATTVEAAHAWAETGFTVDRVSEGGLPPSAFSASARACRGEWERLEGIARLLAG